MTSEEYNKYNEQLMNRLDKIQKAKSVEYNAETDVMHMLKRIARLKNSTIPGAIVDCMSKHIASIYDMVEHGRRSDYILFEEKVVDTINYLYLLHAQVCHTATKKVE